MTCTLLPVICCSARSASLLAEKQGLSWLVQLLPCMSTISLQHKTSPADLILVVYDVFEQNAQQQAPLLEAGLPPSLS